MRRVTRIAGVTTLSISLGILCECLSGCVPGSPWEQFFPNREKTLANAAAIEQGLRLSALVNGEQPFRLLLAISPRPRTLDDSAEVEILWINPITYRTSIRSRTFSQTRIVNGAAVEEHNTGDFYPRRIQNFVDAILEPVPNVAALRKVPGTIPVEALSQGCITGSEASAGGLSANAGPAPEVCFAGPDAKITSGRAATRYVAFDDFEPFGSQQIARTLVNDLPDGELVRARIVRLEPLAKQDYTLLRAKEYTLPAQQMLTTKVDESAAEAALEAAPGGMMPGAHGNRSPALIPAAYRPGARAEGPAAVYVRTDRAGRVREAYWDKASHPELQSSNAEAAVAHASMLKFRPLVIDGVPRQMEATLVLR